MTVTQGGKHEALGELRGGDSPAQVDQEGFTEEVTYGLGGEVPRYRQRDTSALAVRRRSVGTEPGGGSGSAEGCALDASSQRGASCRPGPRGTASIFCWRTLAVVTGGGWD